MSMPPHAYGCDCSSCIPDEGYESCEGDYDDDGEGGTCPDTTRRAGTGSCTPPSIETQLKDLVSEVAFLRQRIEDLEGRPSVQRSDTMRPPAKACYTCGRPVLFSSDASVPRCTLCSR